MIDAGTGLEVPGVVLDATGIGAIGGVPLNIAGGALIAGGATLSGGAAIDLTREAAGESGVIVMNSHTGRPGEGVDRGDGRDPYGNFTGRGSGYGKQREAEGIKKYEGDNPGRWVSREQRKATAAFYDGLARKPDGTYEGVEVKSGTAGPHKQQQAFDNEVGYDNPAYVTITNERGEVQTVEITSVHVETVPAE